MARPDELYRLPRGGRSLAAGIFVTAGVTVVASLLAVVWLTGQWTAWRLGFQAAFDPELWLRPSQSHRLLAGAGATATAALLATTLLSPRWRRLASIPALLTPPLLLLSLGPIYAPWAWFVWVYRFGDLPQVEPIFTAGHWIIGIAAHSLILVAIAVAVRRSRKIGGRADTHGSAQFARRPDVDACGLLAPRGVILGGFTDGRATRYLKHDGPEHCLVFAPSRSGKGTSVVVPTLASWPHSCLVFDPKGENWALTAGWRRRELGSVTLQLNPVAIDGRAARFNPLLEVRRGPLEVRDAQQIADILTSGDLGAEDPHWRATAADLLTGAILHVLYAGRDKSLRGVLGLLSDPASPIESTLTDMLQAAHDPTGEAGWIDPVSRAPTRTHPVVAAAARTMLNRADNEKGSVLSTAIRCLALWRDFVVAENTRESDFSLADLVAHPRPVSLYVTIPVSDLSRTRPLTRLLFALAMRRLTESLDARAGADGRRRILLLLDEFPQLHHIPEFENGLPLVAGFGIKALLVCQDLTQLYRHYGRNQAITSNCDVLVTFKTSNIDTARLVSEMAGTRTVQKETHTYTGARLSPFLPHVMASQQESQRPLVTPDEVMRLPDDATLVFAGGQPIQGVKTPFYLDAEFRGRTEIPAPERSDRIGGAASEWPEPPEASAARPGPGLDAENAELRGLLPLQDAPSEDLEAARDDSEDDLPI